MKFSEYKSLETRVPAILKILKKSTSYLTSREIANLYIENPNNSDVLTTGYVLNVLSFSGFVSKTKIPDQGQRVAKCRYCLIR